MDFLNFFSEAITPMAFPWEMLINGGFEFIASIGWRVVFLVVCLKLVLSPLDFYQRYKMRKNQMITQRLKPQIDKLKHQYAGNTKVLQQKQAELNRKSGMSMFSTCLPAIVSMVIFIWFWISIQNVAQFYQLKDYLLLYDIYVETYDATIGDENIDDYAKDYRAAFDNYFITQYNPESPSANIAQARTYADNEGKNAENALGASVKKHEYDTLYKRAYGDAFVVNFSRNYDLNSDKIKATEAGSNAGQIAATQTSLQYSTKVAQSVTFNFYYGEGEFGEGGERESEAYPMEGFLWIKNVWSADVPWVAPIKASTSEFKTAIGDWATNTDKSTFGKAQLTEIIDAYDDVTALIHSDARNGVNGLMILPVLALLLNFATQMITRRQQKRSGQTQMTEGQAGCMMKVMTFALPIMMFVFALQYTALFTLYMVTNALMSLVINLVSSTISARVVHGQSDKDYSVSGAATSRANIEKYGRPDPTAKSEKTTVDTKHYDKKGGSYKTGVKSGKNKKNNKRK